MELTRTPKRNLLDIRLPWQTWWRRRAAGSPLADLVLNSGWKPGRAIPAGGPLMISMTQYTIKHPTDIPAIWRASERLGDQLAQIEGAVGVLTYFRPARRQVGSLSIWADDKGLAEFMSLPDHVQIMRRYRPRGLPIRSAQWWSEELDIGAALMESLRMLDTDQDRRRVRAHRPSES
ncbi:hypothetical protein [Nocardia sp. XZ_19_385]|uniref:hypothetical protein n=1 Tax=Nocardia sp. XZ_19_385 TaxID=2769488 RepID=UPI00188E6A85|nr:hypothetical protein [Nocardia sp. XZ_19_385]